MTQAVSANDPFLGNSGAVSAGANKTLHLELPERNVMPEQEQLDLARLEMRVSALEQKVQDAQATAYYSSGLAGVTFAFWILWLIFG